MVHHVKCFTKSTDKVPKCRPGRHSSSFDPLPGQICCASRGAQWPSGRASDSGARGGGGGLIPTSAMLCP